MTDFPVGQALAASRLGLRAVPAESSNMFAQVFAFVANITLWQIIQVAVTLLVAQTTLLLIRWRLIIRRLSQSPVPMIRFGPMGPIPSIWRNMHRLYDWQSDLLREHPTVAITQPFWAGYGLIFSTDPRCIEHFLKTNWRNYNKPTSVRQRTLELLGDGIFRLNHGASCSPALPAC